MRKTIRKVVISYPVAAAAVFGSSAISLFLFNNNKLNQSKKIFTRRTKDQIYSHLIEELNYGSTYTSAESIKTLNKLRDENESSFLEIVKRLNHVGWCKLALEGSEFCQFLRPGTSSLQKNTNADTDIDLLILKLELVAKAKRNTYLKLCTEEDLYCQEFSLNYMENDGVIQSLYLLLHKSENAGLMDKTVLPNLLYNLLNHFRNSDKQICLLTLKILANIAYSSQECSEEICKSDWLPLLALMITNPTYDEERVLAHKIIINMLYGFGAESYKISPELPNSQEPILDIVLVHGLWGSAFRTWRQKDKSEEKTTLFWPKDWLAADIKDPIRIIALDYSTKLLQFRGVMESIEGRSKRFQKEFSEAGIGQKPILFICHSLGGLLVKQILLENEALLNQTVGVMFMATPHKGSPVASRYALKLLRPTNDTQLLKIKSELNRELNSNFARISQKVPIWYSVLECDETPIFRTKRILVPLESAIFDHGVVYHVKEHHHHVCKPESKESPVYNIVLNFVRDALHLLGESNHRNH